MKTHTHHSELATVLTTAQHQEGMTVTLLRVRDVHSHRIVGRKLVRAFTAFLQWYLEKNPRKNLKDPTNIAHLLVYSAPGMRAWRAYMPGGIATHHAHRPQDRVLVNGKRIDMITRNFFRHTYESVGLRSRADIMSWLVLRQYEQSGVSPVWASIACGTGQPVYDTLKLLGQEQVEGAKLLMSDIDEDVLEFARQLYSAQDVRAGDAEFIALDVLDQGYSEKLQALQPSVIDAMGLFEYFDDKEAVQLLKITHKVLTKGGQFIFCNMRTDHPQLAVHKRALGWPGVIQRSVDDFARLFSEANIPHESVHVYQAQDGVYNVYQVRR